MRTSIQNDANTASSRSQYYHYYCLLFLLLVLQFTALQAGWIDPDTQSSHHTINPLNENDEREYKLVFSDEFDVDGRRFSDGEDPRWTSLDKNDYTNDALHYYSSDNIITSNGVLNISTYFQTNSFISFNEKTEKRMIETKYIQSGMVQGWNKFCFTGGIVEIRAKLPGHGEVGGLWPALWLLGNLARATYVGSSDYVWPWSYNDCNEDKRVSQEINACDRTEHYGMHGMEGRGAPEIDILEAMGGEPGELPNTNVERPYFSASLQIAPGVKYHRPQLGKLPRKGYWYEGMEYGNTTKTELNPFFYGVTLIHEPKSYTYQSDALSANTPINSSHFQNFHIYRVEWEPSDSNGEGGYIRWFCDGELIYGITPEVLNLTGTHIPNEPMYILMNTAVSTSWGFPLPCPEGCDCECYECGNADCSCGFPEEFCEKNIPANFEIDYVRVYQPKNKNLTKDAHELGCSTARHPTELFIKGHKKRYMSDGQKGDPLKKIRNGGGFCDKDVDCGGSRHGICSKHRCVCNDGFIGLFCLAYHGFNDHEYHTPKLEQSVQKMFFPGGLLIFFILFALSFLITIIYDVKHKQADRARYMLQESVAFVAAASSATYMKDYYAALQEQRNQQNHYPQQMTGEEQPLLYSGIQVSHDDKMNNYFHDSFSSPAMNRRNRLSAIMESPGNSQRLILGVEGNSPVASPIMGSRFHCRREKVVSYCVIDGRLIDD